MMRRGVSVVIPTLNEEGNIFSLTERIDRVFSSTQRQYEIIFIDDHSTDRTCEYINTAAKKYPIRLFSKEGKRGKAYSLLEGFQKVQYKYVAILDADLQYPPEVLQSMIEKLDTGEADIVVVNRTERETTLWRQMLSRGFRFVFGKFLHDLDCDVQAGCKVFRGKILREVVLDPTPWTFDLEFLLSARNYGYVIGTVDIPFIERIHGQSKIHFFKAVYEIGWNAIRLRFRGRPPLLISPETEKNMIGAGIAHNKQRFVTHSTLHPRISALSTFTAWQKNSFLTFVFIILIGLVINPLLTGVIVVGVLSVIYFVDMIFNLGLIVKSLKTPPEIESTLDELQAVPDVVLPVYSILCPLYREAHILPGFVEAIEKIEWPKEKLDVMLLLEEDDKDTIKAAYELNLPKHIRVVVVPHSFPKTKPKACNYGLSLALGEYVVIYDAEDIPDPWQLRKAFIGFRKAGDDVKCLQAKLNYFNPTDNLLTRFFTAEYSLWFDIMLVGLQSINTSLPLGGTSNHFRTKDLLDLEGWDPFNVTEDCDLGVRIFKRGARTAIIDSVTLEEANGNLRNWLRQRSRWVKGYMQTYLVHMRDPFEFVRENGWHAFIFQLVVGGKIAFLLTNPILWITTISYFMFRDSIGPSIEALYIDPVYYMAITSLVLGNFLFMYYYMIGCAKRGHWHLVKWVFLIPLYWVIGSIASYIALYQLIVKPHYWEKTNHGLHLLRGKKKRFQALFDFQEKILGSYTVIARKDLRFIGKIFVPFIFLYDVIFVKPFSRKKAVQKESAQAEVLEEKREVDDVLDLDETPIPLNGSSESIWFMSHARSIKNFLLSQKGFFLLSLFIANIINFLFNAFLGRVLSLEDFGVVAFVNTLWYFAMMFLGAYGTTVNHETAHLFASSKKNSGLWLKSVMRRGIALTAVASIAWILLLPLLSGYFNVDAVILYLFTPVFLFGIMSSTSRGFVQGKLHFNIAASISLFEAISKLLLAAALVFFGFSHLAYLAIPYSVVLTSLFALYFVSRDLSVKQGIRKYSAKFPSQFYMATFMSSLGSLLFLNLDVLLVKHYLDTKITGEYAILALIGKMIFFLGALPASLLVTLVSHVEGRHRNPRSTFYKVYTLTLLVVVGSVIILTLFGNSIVPFLLGDKAQVILPYVSVYAAALGFFTLTSVISTYHLAKKQYVFILIPIFSALFMAFFVVMDHETLRDITFDIFWASFGWWVVIQMMDVFEESISFAHRGIQDFLGLFAKGLPVTGKEDARSRRILIFNWRDKKHKFAGGAEEYVHEIAKEWVIQGHIVTLFCGNDGKSLRHETVDGIHIVRRGGFYLVYAWAFLYYMLRFRGKYDIVIDCQNGIPFFTPIYVRKPVYCLMHHVHQAVFFRDLIKPLAYIASFLEKDLMPIVYRKVKFITVSESSKQEMIEIGLGGSGIDIVHPGVHIEKLEKAVGEKSSRPTVLYLGRLKSYKSVNVLIHAFAKVVKNIPEAQLIIAGDGDDSERLQRFAKDFGFTGDQIVFTGFVSDEEKLRLLKEAWVFVNPSYMEGWGIVVIEANACGTPVIASDVPGLRDSVKHNHSGILVPYGDDVAFANHIVKILEDGKLRDTMSGQAIEWARDFDWKKSSKSFLDIVENYEVAGESGTNQ